MSTDISDYLINEIQNWEFRIEDIILHSLTGVCMAMGLRVREILKRLRTFLKRQRA